MARSNSFAHGNSQSGLASACNGNSSGPASRIITGDRLGGEHWWWLA